MTVKTPLSQRILQVLRWMIRLVILCFLVFMTMVCFIKGTFHFVPPRSVSNVQATAVLASGKRSYCCALQWQEGGTRYVAVVPDARELLTVDHQYHFSSLVTTAHISLITGSIVSLRSEDESIVYDSKIYHHWDQIIASFGGGLLCMMVGWWTVSSWRKRN